MPLHEKLKMHKTTLLHKDTISKRLKFVNKKNTSRGE